MPKRRVAIVVDSAASLPEEFSERFGLFVVPMQLHIDGATYLDGRDITPSEFYRMLRQSSAIPTTSAPSPASFLESFQQASQIAESVLCLTVSSQFSASLNSANTAAREALQQLPDLKVHLMDTRSAAGGEALIALEALRSADRGDSLTCVTKIAEAVVSKVSLIASVDTLQYLSMSGRVPRLAHVATSLLRMKPIFELAGGDVSTVARPRTQRRATAKLIDVMREKVGANKTHATVMHADAPELANEMRNLIDSQFDCIELFISEFTPVMGAHIGPGLLGIAFWCE